MANDKTEPSVSQELFTTSYSLRSTDSKSEKFVDPGTSFEVFRNNTTAVEVIVKEVPNKTKKANITKNIGATQNNKSKLNENKLENMMDEIELLKLEVNRANNRYLTGKQNFRMLVFELKKQLDVVFQREVDQQTKNLSLQLENEKLKTLLDAKSNLVTRLRKELSNMKRSLKFIVMGICSAPQVPESITYSSDVEYDDFEKGLKKGSHVKFATNFEGLGGLGTGTFDSTLSRDMNFTEKY